MIRKVKTCKECGCQLIHVPADEPKHPEYLICPKCDSSYPVDASPTQKDQKPFTNFVNKVFNHFSELPTIDG